MRIEPYNHSDKHIKHLTQLLHLRDLPLNLASTIPYMGAIVFDKKIPAAIGFIRFLEGGYGVMDSVITNPSCSSQVRHEAYDALVVNLLAESKLQGMTHVYATTEDEGTIERARRHGFQMLSLTPLLKEL